ncbi:MAG: DUF502 domain-containing protein [Alphaproteobacteria bacterium]
MKPFLSFLKTTILGGLVFLVPFTLLLMILGKAYALVLATFDPLFERLHIESGLGFEIPWLLTALVMLTLCFLAGLLARMRLARRFSQWLEDKILSMIPGYNFMKSMGEEVAGVDHPHHYPPVLAQYQEYSVFGFLMERLASGHVVVFVPDAPRVWSGQIILMEDHQVTLLDASAGQTIQCLKHLGAGAGKILPAKMPLPYAAK